MVNARPIDLNVSCKLHPYSSQRARRSVSLPLGVIIITWTRISNPLGKTWTWRWPCGWDQGIHCWTVEELATALRWLPNTPITKLYHETCFSYPLTDKCRRKSNSTITNEIWLLRRCSFHYSLSLSLSLSLSYHIYQPLRSGRILHKVNF